jgi:hypothetical protein
LFKLTISIRRFFISDVIVSVLVLTSELISFRCLVSLTSHRI